MPKYTYQFDEQNRLLIISRKEKIPVAGTFSVDKHNNLIFWPKAKKDWIRKYDLPSKIACIGRWELGREHDLVFILRKSKRHKTSQRVYFKGQIKDVSSNALSFAVTSKQEFQRSAISLLKLSGRWQADRYNRLNFLIKRTIDTYDTLTFRGQWQIKNNTLTYDYAKTDLKSGKKFQRELSFKGFWQITRRNRISYVLDVQNGSEFDFKVQAGSASLKGKKGVIKYRLILGVKGKSEEEKDITLGGKWKFGRKGTISFEVDSGPGKAKTIDFTCSYYLDNRKKITVLLRNRKGQSLGLRITLETKFLKNNARFFLQGENLDAALRLKVGMGLRW